MTEGSAGPVDATIERRREMWREGVMMAVYVSLSLLAVMIAWPGDIGAAAVAVTSLGLVLAHRFAFRISTQLVNEGRLDAEHLEVLGAQLVGGLLVTVVAMLPLLVLEGETSVLVAELLLVAFIGAAGYAAARSRSAPPLRAAFYMARVIGLALLVIAVKTFSAH